MRGQQNIKCFKSYIKLSCNKSWRLRGGMECWASILTWTFGTILSLLHTDCTSPPREFLATHFCKWLSEPYGYWMQTEGQILPGTEPETSNLMAHCLNQLHHCSSYASWTNFEWSVNFFLLRLCLFLFIFQVVCFHWYIFMLMSKRHSDYFINSEPLWTVNPSAGWRWIVSFML